MDDSLKCSVLKHFGFGLGLSAHEEKQAVALHSSLPDLQRVCSHMTLVLLCMSSSHLLPACSGEYSPQIQDLPSSCFE